MIHCAIFKKEINKLKELEVELEDEIYSFSAVEEINKEDIIDIKQSILGNHIIISIFYTKKDKNGL